jgi:hypothetical protein
MSGWLTEACGSTMPFARASPLRSPSGRLLPRPPLKRIICFAMPSLWSGRGRRDDDASWERFLTISESFPLSARLVVDRQLRGAALSGQEIKARWDFVRRTIELEEKLELIKDPERGS